MREGLVGAWSYVRLYTIDANGTSGDPVTPPPTPRTAPPLAPAHVTGSLAPVFGSGHE